MVNILIEGMTENAGGKESYVMNFFRAIDRSKYKFVFVAYCPRIAYEEEIVLLGGKVEHLPPRCAGLIKYRKAIGALMGKGNFDVVWAHKTTLSSCEVLEIAKKKKVPVIMVHSHSSANMGGKFTYIMHQLNKRRIHKWGTHFLACSEVAAKWFYGNHKAEIIKNAIDVEKFKFSERVRERIRKEYGLEDDKVICQVGRLSKEKNHDWTLNVMAAFVKKEPRCCLLICGDGDERDSIVKKIVELGLDGNVKMLGSVGNIHEVLQAADAMIMPSFFEGLPFALLEGQCAGLRFLASDTVSRESSLFQDNVFLPLQATECDWVNELEKLVTHERNRNEDYLRVIEAGFDLSSNVRRIEKMINSALEA